MDLWRGLFKRLLSISLDEVRFERRGFRTSSPSARERLEGIGLTFLEGYHAALTENGPSQLAQQLDLLDSERRSFAYEGAAMALTLLDLLTPWKRDRWQAFVRGPGKAHMYMVHVGAGWALARLKKRVGGFLSRSDPLLGWLAVDGYGFHEGYFYWPRSLEARKVPTRLRGYAKRAFDQGLGRGLWFVEGGDPDRIQKRISAFSSFRHSDLWSGIGLAATYAGGVDPTVHEEIFRGAVSYRPHIAQGAAFAAKARQLAGSSTEATEQACQIFCDLSADEAARWTDEVLVDLPRSEDPLVPSYESWRRRLEERFKEHLLSRIGGPEATG